MTISGHGLHSTALPHHVPGGAEISSAPQVVDLADRASSKRMRREDAFSWLNAHTAEP